jgi:hypothetical protein
MHEQYDPTNTAVDWTYCPACFQIVRCGHLKYVGTFAYHRHYLNPDARSVPENQREHCINSGWPVHAAFFTREDGRVVTREQYEAGWAPHDPEPAKEATA